MKRDLGDMVMINIEEIYQLEDAQVFADLSSLWQDGSLICSSLNVCKL